MPSTLQPHPATDPANDQDRSYNLASDFMPLCQTPLRESKDRALPSNNSVPISSPGWPFPLPFLRSAGTDPVSIGDCACSTCLLEREDLTHVHPRQRNQLASVPSDTAIFSQINPIAKRPSHGEA